MDTAKECIHIDLRHAIMMVARALDYVGIDDVNHGHRVGYIAFECAKRLGWDEKRREFVFLAGLLHDCGVSSTAEHHKLLDDFQPESAQCHCDRGYDYLRACPILHPFAEVIHLHHTPWQDLAALDVDDETRETANLICLADRVDFLRSKYVTDHHPDTVVLHEQRIADDVMKRAGFLFSPVLAEAMASLAGVDGFWFTMDQGYIEDIALSFPSDGVYDMPLSIEETTELAVFMSRIVDAKSPFTLEHSERVARIARELAADFDLPEWEQRQIHVAGLLHDVGKLRVPDAILHKPGLLDEEEYAVIKRHVIDTGLALRRSFPGSPIPAWAANHHEKIDGSGYPYRLKGDELDLPSRIIAVADIFQALAQDRPYRGRLTFDEIIGIMAPMVDQGRLDRDVFAKVTDRADAYYGLATA